MKLTKIKKYLPHIFALIAVLIFSPLIFRAVIAKAAVSLQQTVSGSLGDGGGTSFKLTSWTPAANELILVAVSMRNNSGGDPTVSGNGLAFVQVAKSSNGRIPVMSTYLFRAMGSSPTSGQITVNTPGNSNPVFAVASKFNGVDTSGTNGSGAIEAFVTNNAGTTDNDDMKTAITSLTNNTWAYSAGYHRNTNFTLPSGESAISINNISGTGGDTVYLSTWYESVTNPGTVTVGADIDLSGTTPWSTVAVIIKSPAALTPTVTPIPTATSTPEPTPTVIKDLDAENSIYSYSGSSYYSLDPNFDGSRTIQDDVTVFLISGTLEITENFILTNPNDVVAFIVNGNIQIGGSVTELAGLYISSQTISFASANQPITINGMMYAKKFNLGRTYADPDLPAYQFIYQPQYLIRLLPYLGRARINWQDLTP